MSSTAQLGDSVISPALASEQTLPASWWHSEKIFELEKRAIFHKAWLFCIHESRFERVGDYYAFNAHGINFFLIKSKADGAIKAFHNFCRHRAFPIVRKQSGSSTVLGCKYHGWSYNSNGKLIKAPQFDNVDGFSKEENSLFPINTHVTPQGLVFVNFSKNPMPFTEWFSGLTEEMNDFDFADYEYYMSFELHGDFNWKTLVDGYQECYHCPTAHPTLSLAFKMETYEVVSKNRYCRHYASNVKNESKEEVDKVPQNLSSWFRFGKKTQEAPSLRKCNPGGEFDGLWVYLFPNNGINCYSPAWYSIRVLPLSATKTTLQYDIYTRKALDDREKTEFVDFLQQVEKEDYDLCTLTQKNLNEGIYTTGRLHPQKENGVLFYQGLVRDMVKEHYKLEQEIGGPIDSAAINGNSNVNNKEFMELESICQNAECASRGKREFNW